MNRPGRLAQCLGGLCAVWLILACVLVAGCRSGRTGTSGLGPDVIQDFPLERIERPSTADSSLLAGPFVLRKDKGMATIVSVRSSLHSGAFDLVVSVNGAEFSRRRVGRLGENLSIVPVPDDESATLEILQAPNSGPLDVHFLRAVIESVNPADALDVAAHAADSFEAETGQIADPAVENMVPNASFAADDEVRGTPADWFAYVETSTNVLERRLRVWGTAPGRRPYVATGPMRVESGRRYRILVRLTVRDGAVALRVADYEELRVLVDLGSVSAADGPVEHRVDFTASDADRAARIRFEPTTPGVPADFEITAIQMELLP